MRQLLLLMLGLACLLVAVPRAGALPKPEPAPSRPVDLEQEPDTGDLAHALGSRIDVRAIIKAIYEELDEDIPDDFEDVEVDRDDMPDFQEVQSNVQRGEITNADIQVAIELFKEDTFDEDTEDNFGDGDAPSRMPPKQEVGDSTKRNFANSLYNRLEEDCQEREEDLAPCKPQMERLKSVQSLLFSVQDHMCSSDADDDCDDDSDEYVLTMGFANYIERSIGSTLKHQEELENLGSDEEDEEDYTEEDDDEKRKKRKRRKRGIDGREHILPLPEFKCYSKDPCKKLETQEDALKDLDLDQECLPSICTVSRQDFPLYLRAVQAADASKAVGSVALALSTLGHLPRCAQDDADMFLDRVDVDSDDEDQIRDIIEDMWADGVTEDLSKGDRELALGVLFSGLKKDCMEHGFKDAPVCRPGEMRSITSAVVKAKKKQILCQQPFCSSESEEEDGADELNEVEELLTEGECGIHDADLDCAPRHICNRDTAGGLSTRDGFAYCQLPACNLESEDQLFQFLRQKLRKGGAEIGSGDGGNRLATLLHVLRPGDTDVLKEVVEEADLDSVEAGVLEDLLDGKDVDEDDQKDLVEKLEDELECGEVPEGAEACTRRDEDYNQIIQTLNKFYNRNECDDDGGDLDDCTQDDLEDIQKWVDYTDERAAFLMEADQDPDDAPEKPSREPSACRSSAICKLILNAKESYPSPSCTPAVCSGNIATILRLKKLKESKTGDRRGDSPLGVCAFLSALPYRADELDGDISDSIVDRLDLDDSEEDYLLDVLSKLGDDWDPEDPLTFNQDESDILETLLKKCKDDECSFKKSFAAECGNADNSAILDDELVYNRFCNLDLDSCNTPAKEKAAEAMGEAFVNSLASKRLGGRGGGGSKKDSPDCRPSAFCDAVELAKDERATGRYECKPRACNVAEGEAAEAIAFFRGKAAKNEQKGKGSVGKVSGTGGLSKDEKAAIEERRKLAVAAAKSELDQKKAEYAARSKGFLWMELDSDEECDQDVESDDSEVKSGKESLAEDLCSEDGEIVEFCRLKTKRSGDEWRKSEFKCAFKVVET